MADISKCVNKNCKIKKECYRYTAKDDKYWQSYFMGSDKKIEKKEDCDNFWDNKKRGGLRNERTRYI